MKIIWNYSDNWTKGFFTLRKKNIKVKNDVISSTLNGILTLNPFGTLPKLPKKLASDEFLTFRYPKSKFTKK